jgi:hypothetical protein
LNDNDEAPTVSINSPVAVTEGTAVTYTVTLNAVSGLPVTVSYNTANGTAIAGSDYTAVVGGSVTIPAGSTTNTFTVTTTDDTIDENNGETFTVTLSGPTNATL